MSSWFKKTRNIVITVGAGILAVVTIALVIWGVTHHIEGGLLEVCWLDDGRAVYINASDLEVGKITNESCERVEKLRWPQKQIPITISAISAEKRLLGENTPQVRVLKQAAADLNAQLGFTLYRVGYGVLPTSAEVWFGRAFEKTSKGTSPISPGYVTHIQVDGVLRGYIYVRSDVESVDRYLYLVLQHELLHLGGLAHDSFRSSIMFPLTREEWNVEHMSTAHITDNDIRLLRSMYYRSLIASDQVASDL